MPLTPDTCWSALATRDARFDGWFYVGVVTTGIYCRPSCPARPHPENVRFYATAAAAQAAGLRACKRCRPDAVPGSPEWDRRADAVGRAMRLVADGVVDRDGVAGLAAALGYSERHLGRLLIEEVGVGPLALARARRAHAARILLETTDVRVTDVVWAAGFGSVRQFNDTIREVFAMAPRELRARSRRGARPGARGGHRAAPAGPRAARRRRPARLLRRARGRRDRRGRRRRLPPLPLAPERPRRRGADARRFPRRRRALSPARPARPRHRGAALPRPARPRRRSRRRRRRARDRPGHRPARARPPRAAGARHRRRLRARGPGRARPAGLGARRRHAGRAARARARRAAARARRRRHPRLPDRRGARRARPRDRGDAARPRPRPGRPVAAPSPTASSCSARAPTPSRRARRS